MIYEFFIHILLLRFGYLEAGAPYLFLKELRKFCFNWLIFGRELLGGSWIILSYRIDLSGFFIDLYGFLLICMVSLLICMVS